VSNRKSEKEKVKVRKVESEQALKKLEIGSRIRNTRHI